MNTIGCCIKNCKSVFSTTEPLLSTVRYICREHNKTDQSKAAHFQDCQFDPELRNKSKESRAVSNEEREIEGFPMSPDEKCEHGVFDPIKDQRYCSICKPAHVTAVLSELKETKIGKIGVFVNPNEQEDQSNALLLFYGFLPEEAQPVWFRNRELAMHTKVKNMIHALIKTNGTIGDQFLSSGENE
jgi:hypothetical protein